MPPAGPVRAYLNELRGNLAHGGATEHTHRPALQRLLEAMDSQAQITNEPRRIECGAPDMAVTRASAGNAAVGYLEAKDVGVDLEAVEQDSGRRQPATDNGRQFKRYRRNLSNLVLTNYVEFRWYVDGETKLSARLAAESTGGLELDGHGAEKVRALLGGFLHHAAEPAASAAELAERMARVTHMIRAMVEQSFERGHVSPSLRDLFDATRAALVPDLEPADFADMFAQTLAYGLFAARVNHGVGPFHWQAAARGIPTTNPFMRQMFHAVAGPDLGDEPFASFVDDLAQLLAAAEMDQVLADFGALGARQDPIMHFYETFLAAYDPTQRERRGVYYTPEPVISYIVRSVDHLLREQFDCPDGLADTSMTTYRDHTGTVHESHRVLVLDPACGTGSFLYAVVRHVREQVQASGRAGQWRGYVHRHLLPRLFGFELLMAAYAMAQLKLGLELEARDLPDDERAAWAYQFEPGERLGVYLTNALEPGEGQAHPMFGSLMRALAEEADAATGVKRDLPIMVVLGNPPYSGHSANASRRDGALTWIGKLIEDYKKVDGRPLAERNPRWLQDDYVKFIRFGQQRIQQSGAGVLAFVTNHAYLNNPTFRGMRQQLLKTFSDIYLLDLHGNVKLRERAPDGGKDENVFDIQQGAAIGIFVKAPGATGPARVHHADLWGGREGKYAALTETDVSTTAWELLKPQSPAYLFKPWDARLERAYRQWPAITDIMPTNSVGVVTARDKLTIQWTPDDVMNVVRDFASLDSETARRKYRLGRDAQDWKVRLAQLDLNESGIRDELVVPILYRPFDVRYTYYTGASRGFICRPRNDVMRNMIDGNNLALSTTRSIEIQGGFEHVFVSKYITQHHTVSIKEVNYLFPLYTYPKEEEVENGHSTPGDRTPNIDSSFREALEQRLGLRCTGGGRGDLASTFGPEDALHYIYAVLHSPTYRRRYAQFLRADFPRVPPPDGLERFRALAALGRELTELHLLESPTIDAADIGYPISGDDVVEAGHPKYVAPGETPFGDTKPAAEGRVYISRSSPPRRANGRNRSNDRRYGQYFSNIAPEVWAFRIGGYQPLEKWLKDRKGRELSFDDMEHYSRMAAALRETLRVMADIDAAGLPDA